MLAESREEGWLFMFELPLMLKGRVTGKKEEKQEEEKLQLSRRHILFIIYLEEEKIWQCLPK